MKIAIKILAIVFICISASAQEMRPLDIGDEVPEMEFKLMSVNGKETTARFSDYKGKFVILDFWSTGCLSCSEAMPKMDAWQKKYKSSLEVILVNDYLRNTKAIVSRYYERLTKKYPAFGLSTIVGDTQFTKLFPHVGWPHYVLIDSSGIVKAIPLSHQITEPNIAKFLSGQPINLTKRVDFKQHLFLPMGDYNDVNIGEFESVRIFKKGKIPELGGFNSGRIIMDSNDNKKLLRGYAFRNMPLRDIYWTVLKGLNNSLSEDKYRTLYDLKNPKVIASWDEKNLYTYDIIIPKNKALQDSLAVYKQMLLDINEFSPFIAGIEKRKIRCLILIRTSQIDNFKAKGKTPFERLPLYLRTKKGIALPLIDETGFDRNIDIDFTTFSESINDIRNQLRKYDLDLIEAEREIEMFIIRDKGPKLN